MENKNVKMFRLLSGEDLIGEYVGVSEDNTEVLFKNVLQIILSPPQQGATEQKIAVVPYPQYVNPKQTDVEIYLNKSSFVFTFKDADEQFVEMYNSVFNKIVTPFKNIIL